MPHQAVSYTCLVSGNFPCHGSRGLCSVTLGMKGWVLKPGPSLLTFRLVYKPLSGQRHRVGLDRSHPRQRETAGRCSPDIVNGTKAMNNFLCPLCNMCYFHVTVWWMRQRPHSCVLSGVGFFIEVRGDGASLLATFKQLLSLLNRENGTRF